MKTIKEYLTEQIERYGYDSVITEAKLNDMTRKKTLLGNDIQVGDKLIGVFIASKMKDPFTGEIAITYRFTLITDSEIQYYNDFYFVDEDWESDFGDKFIAIKER